MSETKQINFKIPKSFYDSASKYCKKHDYTNIQELLREILRDKISKEKASKNRNKPEHIRNSKCKKSPEKKRR